MWTLVREGFEDVATWIRDSLRSNIFVAMSILILLIIVTLPLFLTCAFILLIIAVGGDLAGGESAFCSVDATHVPTFYSPIHQYNRYWHPFLLLVLASIFGGIHCAGWNFSFPSYGQQMLWRVASLTVAILPLIALPMGILIASILVKCICRDLDVLQCALAFANDIIVPTYAAARLILLGQAIALLRHLPPSALTVIDWSQFFPHFF